MEFDELKRYTLLRLRDAISKKEVDKPIIPLLDTINSLKDYFTTSSCAGRIVLMKIPKSGKKNETKFLFKTHYPTSVEDILDILYNIELPEESIWFKQEPFILHISSRDINSAKKMLEIAHKVGLKHSGIIAISNERIVIEVQSTERIETIISKSHKLLVNESYIECLVNEANKKLLKTRKRMEKLLSILKASKGD